MRYTAKTLDGRTLKNFSAPDDLSAAIEVEDVGELALYRGGQLIVVMRDVPEEDVDPSQIPF